MSLQEINNRRYKIRNDTHYNEKTADSMVTLLEHIRALQVRCRFHWGDVKTGQDWGDCWDVKGRIGRSGGSIKIPILLYNSRSLGGGAILDHCIVKITGSRGGRVLYEHPKYHVV